MDSPAQTASRPVAGRSCGTCTLCCKLFDIRELDKPQFAWCRHCDVGNGCRIYDERPEECREFSCSYLTEPGLDEAWKPSRSRIVLTREQGNLIGVHVDPDRAEAWRKEPYHSHIRHWAAEAARKGAGRVIVWEGRSAIVLLPDGDKNLGLVPAGHHIVFRTRPGPGGRPVADAVVMSADDPRWSGSEFAGALRSDADFADAHFNRGLTFAAKGDTQRALADFDAALAKAPQLAAAWDARGIAAAQAGRMAEAVANAAEATRLAPDNAGFHNNRGMILAAAGEEADAAAAFDRALALDPDYARAWFNRGLARLRSGDRDRALTDLGRAVRLDGGYVAALAERAALLFALGRFAEAEADFAAAVRADPDGGLRWALWRHVARARAGMVALPLPDGVDGRAWPAPLAAMFRGDIGPGLAITAAPDGDADGPFFVGEFHLLGGDAHAAADHFRRAVETGDETSHAFDCARAELERLES